MTKLWFKRVLSAFAHTCMIMKQFCINEWYVLKTICRCARAPIPRTKSILLMIINISLKNVDFELFHRMWNQNRFQNGTVGVRAHLHDHETDFKVWGVSFENNCRCVRAATPRTKSIFLVIMEISHENVDFSLFHSICDQNRLQNGIVGIREDLYDYKKTF